MMSIRSLNLFQLNFILVAILLSEILSASDISLSIREVCRRRVAGEYLNIHDSTVRLKGLIDRHHSQIRAVKEVIQAATTEFDMASDKLKNDYFNTQLAYRLAVAKSKVETNRSLLRDLHENLDVLEAKNKIAAKKALLVKNGIKGVFALVKVTQTNLGYPFQLAYTRKCPKFQDGCSLLKQERAAMQRLFGTEAIPKIPSCKKYMNQGVYDANRD